MFYVYALIDPRDSTVFYVGKGKGNRIEAHERQARSGDGGAKCDRIREIWGAGASVIARKLGTFKRETDAYHEEARLITEIGLGALTNIAPGGRGGRHKRKPVCWNAKMVKAIAPSLRRALSEMANGNGRLYVGGHDITEHVERLMGVLRREAGDEVIEKNAGVVFA